MPVYLVKHGEGEAAKERLIEANDSRGARGFVAREIIEVGLASQSDLFRVAKAGGDIEVAKEAPADPPGDGEKGGEEEGKGQKAD